jgi:hypothetical protein
MAIVSEPQTSTRNGEPRQERGTLNETLTASPIPVRAMTHLPNSSNDKSGMFPARLIRPEERALVAAWLAAAGDIFLAYVSSRRGDSQEFYRRIVITVGDDEEPSYLINAPKGTNVWVVHPYSPEQQVVHFASLREALNSIRPVLTDPWRTTTTEFLHRLSQPKPSVRFVRKGHRPRKPA